MEDVWCGVGGAGGLFARARFFSLRGGLLLWRVPVCGRSWVEVGVGRLEDVVAGGLCGLLCRRGLGGVRWAGGCGGWRGTGLASAVLRCVGRSGPAGGCNSHGLLRLRPRRVCCV